MKTILTLARKAAGLDQIDLGNALDTNNATISRMESGAHMASREKVRALHDFYGGIIPLAWCYDPQHPDAPTELTKTQENKLERMGKRYRKAMAA